MLSGAAASGPDRAGGSTPRPLTGGDPIRACSRADLKQHPTRRGQAVAPATVRAARTDLQGFIAWWEQTHRLSFDVALVLDRELRQWPLHRQREDGAKPSTINRANASLRAFFAWAQREKVITHNPATDLHDLPLHEIVPRSVPPPALDWLLRAIAAQDATTRLRDLTLLALLSDCGLRAQEAADVQLRDLDFDGAMLTVRSGKGRNTRRVPLTAAVVARFVTISSSAARRACHGLGARRSAKRCS